MNIKEMSLYLTKREKDREGSNINFCGAVVCLLMERTTFTALIYALIR